MPREVRRPQLTSQVRPAHRSPLARRHRLVGRWVRSPCGPRNGVVTGELAAAYGAQDTYMPTETLTFAPAAGRSRAILCVPPSVGGLTIIIVPRRRHLLARGFQLGALQPSPPRHTCGSAPASRRAAAPLPSPPAPVAPPPCTCTCTCTRTRRAHARTSRTHTHMHGRTCTLLHAHGHVHAHVDAHAHVHVYQQAAGGSGGCRGGSAAQLCYMRACPSFTSLRGYSRMWSSSRHA